MNKPKGKLPFTIVDAIYNYFHDIKLKDIKDANGIIVARELLIEDAEYLVECANSYQSVLVFEEKYENKIKK